MVYDTLRLYGGKPEWFDITKELLNLALNQLLNLYNKNYNKKDYYII